MKFKRLTFFPFTVAVLVFGLAIIAGCAAAPEKKFPEPPVEPAAAKTAGLETAVFAGGCFWGVEGVFESLKGVKSAVSGYAGGQAATADYETVCTGTTGHAESVQVSYDPQLISYGTLLKVFFSVAHNPTELNFQGPDHGSQYRSAIFFSNAAQKKLAETYILALESAKIFSSPIVTALTPLKAFYLAEDYHQNFMALHPDHGYIRAYDLPKLADLKRRYPELVAKN